MAPKGLATLFFMVLFAVSVPQQALSQSEDSISVKSAAANHIKKLKDGILVVRLATKQRSIEALESTLASSDLKSKLRETLEEQLVAKKYERDSVNNALISAFGGEVYDFSEVYFMYDTSNARFANKEMSGYFYNENGEFDPSLSLEGRDYYMTYIGRTEQSSSTNTKAFVVCDQYLNPLERPFPGYITFRRLLSTAKSGKKKKKAKGVFKGFRIEEIVEKVDGSFEWFYKENH